ncbi:pyruvate formate lyase family protein, partial [Acinetobacter sp. 163]|nr:pyruvate formate lyase family protein [Acinetobacter sp. 163]
FTRTNKNITEVYTFKDIEKEYDVNNKYYNVINNVCPDYKILLEKGLIGLKKEIDEQKKSSSLEEMDFLDSCEITIE